MFGLISRCTVSVLRDPVLPDATRMQVYIDDPVVTIRGTPDIRQEQVALLVLAWAVLGVGPSFRKGQLGRAIHWIGAEFRLESDAVAGETGV